MEKWKVKIAVRPLGATGDPNLTRAIGGAVHEYEVDAVDFAGAVAAAELIMLGIRSNFYVWSAVLISVGQVGPSIAEAPRAGPAELPSVERMTLPGMV